MLGVVITLAECRGRDRRVIGGKAVALAELAGAGFSVPDGFCITTEGMRAIDADGSLPHEFERAVLDAYHAMGSVPVAVRSSAVEEDSADYSFAGIYETKLNVVGDEAIMHAIQQCSRAYAHQSAMAYGTQNNRPASLGLALVVQPMLPAIAAGVVFTANPATARLGEMVVNSTIGLAEPLVAGEIDADQFVLNREDGRMLSVHLGKKEAVLEAIGTRIERLSPLERPSLSESELRELWALALRVEAHYGGYPQDIEWVRTEQGYHLLQSRPITTLATEYYTRQLELWASQPASGERQDTVRTRAWSDEFWTRPTSPLFYTTHNLTGAFGRYFSVVGHKGDLPVAVFRRYRAAAYLDVRLLEAQIAYQPKFARVPGLLNLLPEVMQSDVASRPWQWKGRVRQLWRLEVKERATSSLRNNHRVVDRQWPLWQKTVEEWRQLDLDTLGPDGLLNHLATVHVESGKVGMPCSVGVFFHAQDLSLVLQGLLRRWLDDNGTLFARLTSALDGSETVKEAHALWTLARKAGVDKQLEEAVRRHSFEDLSEQVATLPGGSEFLSSIAEFLSSHYHRGANYKDVMWSRWGDDPDLLLASIRLYLDEHSEDPTVLQKRQAAVRRRATHEVKLLLRRSGVTGQLRAAIILCVLKYAQTYLALRDNHRFYYDFSHWEVRRTFLAMGRLICQSGGLDRAEDVFLLGQSEVLSALRGELAYSEVKRRAQVRKKQFDEDCNSQAPKFLRGDHALEVANQTQSHADVVGLAAGFGVVTGTARVLRDVSEFSRVRRGDILVAHQTDPGWTPLFSHIGGLVLETGSVLAHGASLAREYGLPAVTAAEGATRLIADGDVVTVNGSTGTVLIHRGGDA